MFFFGSGIARDFSVVFFLFCPFSFFAAFWSWKLLFHMICATLSTSNQTSQFFVSAKFPSFRGDPGAKVFVSFLLPLRIFATVMQPLQCVLHQHVHIHSTRHHFPLSPSFVTTLRHHPSPFAITSLNHHPSLPSFVWCIVTSSSPCVITSLKHHPSLPSFKFMWCICIAMWCTVVWCKVSQFCLSVTRKIASQLPLISVSNLKLPPPACPGTTCKSMMFQSKRLSQEWGWMGFEWMNGLIDGWMGGLMDGWMDEWMDGCFKFRRSYSSPTLQRPFNPSVGSLCRPWFPTTHLSYRFPIFETSATALCSTTCMHICRRSV